MESILFYFYSANGKSTTLLRFYNDGIVVKAIVSRQIKDFGKVLEWLKKDNGKSNITSGKYFRQADKVEIVFTNKSESRYSVNFENSQIRLLKVSSSFQKKHIADLSVVGNIVQFIWNEQKLFSPYQFKPVEIPPLLRLKKIEPLRPTNYEQPKPFSLLEECEKMFKESDRQESIRLTKWVKDREAQEAKRIEQEIRRKEEEKAAFGKLAGIAAFVIFIVFIFSMCTRQRVGCHCWDGAESSATGSGACSWHGGVMYWKHKYWWEKD